MGRTIPSFRIALAMEEAEWKPFRNVLGKIPGTKVFRSKRLSPPRIGRMGCISL
jgi:hypothetical protein